MFSSYEAEFFGATRYFHPRMSLRLGVFKLLEMDGSQQGRGQECSCPRRLLQPAGRLLGVPCLHVRPDRRGRESQSRRLLSVRETVLCFALKRKAAKEKELPVHHKLEELLDQYLKASGLARIFHHKCKKVAKFFI